MILEALRSLVLEDDTPSYYKPQVVSWVIHLTDSGEFVSISDTRSKQDPLQLTLPTNGRSRDTSPRIAADNASYVLPYGCYQTNKQENLMNERHTAFGVITNECAERSELIRAVQQFLDSDMFEVIAPYNKDIKDSDTVAFMVDGEYVGKQKEIAAFWREKNGQGRSHELHGAEVTLRCLICGEPMGGVIDAYVFQGVTVRDKVSMIPWKEGTDYTFSYGLHRGENSPICSTCSDFITRNYNALHNQHALKIAAIEYLILSKQPDAVKQSISMLTRPQEDDIRALHRINQARLRERGQLEYDEHFWLLFTTAPSPGRGWFFGREYSLNRIRDRVEKWLKSQEIMGNTEDIERFSVGQILSHLYATKQGKHTQDAVHNKTLDQTFSAVLEGRALPRQLLFLALQRNRAETRVTKQRAILLNVLLSQVEGVNRMGLDNTEKNKGYLLGRVLSLVAQAQQEAIGKVNAPLSARFWSGFSTAPAMSFPRLMGMYNQYHNKLLKVRPGSAIHISRQLGEVLSLIGSTCPNRLTMEEQAAFALGFYYQEQLRFQRRTGETETDDPVTEGEQELSEADA